MRVQIAVLLGLVRPGPVRPDLTPYRRASFQLIISGIRPQIAQTIVHLGLQLDVVSKATMADAFALALKRTEQVIGRAAAKPVPPR